MRLALTAGGTGGHIFPALAVMDAMVARAPGSEVAFFGPDDRGERALVEPRGIPFVRVPSAAVRGRGPLGLLRSAWRLSAGILAALGALRKFRPDVVFSTGGYGSFPCSVAARVLRRPLVVYLPDVSPGWAVRAESRLATRMATTAEAALAFLPAKKTRVTGYPVRSEFFTWDREAARASLGIDEHERVVLIAGASQGARAINVAVFAALAQLLPQATLVHVTGQTDATAAREQRTALAPELAARYQPAPFRSDLPAVMLAADVAVMRAGASTLGELTAAGLPAILVPGRYAGGHQRDNAAWLANAGAAMVMEEADLGTLGETLVALLANTERLAAMGAAARGLAKPTAAADIAALIEEVARR